MRVLTLMILGAGLLIAADSPQPSVAKKELEAFQGTWTMLSLEVDGQPVAEENVKRFKLRIAGDQWTVFVDDKPAVHFTLKVDPTKTPKALDLTQVVDVKKPQTFHGIYDLDKGTLKLCRRLEAAKERPTQFVTQPKSGLLLVVWKRVSA